MDLTGMAISVVAYKEPDYLYVTLDGLTRAEGVEAFPITVYFDGLLSDDQVAEQEKVLAAFPSVSRAFSDAHLGILGNVVRAIRSPIQAGARLVLYIEDDHMVRPDFLDVPMNDDSDCFFVGLSYSEKTSMVKYIPKGNVIAAEKTVRLFAWIDAKEYLGLPKNPLTPSRKPEDLIDEHYTGHDFIFNAFMHVHGEKTSLPHGMYLAHVGLFGTNLPRCDAPPEQREIENRMLEGPREGWLDNIARIMKAGDYPTEPSFLNSRLWPRGFAYYGDVADRTI